MNINDAFSILNISGHVTPACIKTAYRKATAKYHPDRNLAGLEMMKLINAAYEAIKNFEGDAEKNDHENYGDALNTALNAIINFGLDIEICGAWIWVNGNTKIYREQLKAAGYRWAPQKLSWYFRPIEYKSSNRSSWSKEKIRNAYGSYVVKEEQKKLSN